MRRILCQPGKGQAAPQREADTISKSYDAFAAVYDRLMDDVDYGAWYKHYRALFARAGIGKPRSVADVCCGTGAFAIRFAKDGAGVVGIDLSEEMLQAAQREARKAGTRVQFVHMDATQLRLPKPADAILCACDGVNYLSTPDAAQSFFRRAHAALRPGGALAFDVSTEHKFLHRLDGRAFGEDREDLCFLWTNAYEKETRLCHMELTLFTEESGGRFSRAFETHTQRAHSPEELEAWLSDAGFARVELFSDMILEPVRGDEDRLHVLAIRS